MNKTNILLIGIIPVGIVLGFIVGIKYNDSNDATLIKNAFKSGFVFGLDRVTEVVNEKGKLEKNDPVYTKMLECKNLEIIIDENKHLKFK